MERSRAGALCGIRLLMSHLPDLHMEYYGILCLSIGISHPTDGVLYHTNRVIDVPLYWQGIRTRALADGPLSGRRSHNLGRMVPPVDRLPVVPDDTASNGSEHELRERHCRGNLCAGDRSLFFLCPRTIHRTHIGAIGRRQCWREMKL